MMNNTLIQVRTLFRAAQNPTALLLPKQILLLSHMRAYTSLFGHILGSHDEIRGYYEMHQGYYSWRSLIRAQLSYLEEHVPKPGSRYLFDKVLHNEHHVNTKALRSNRVKPILMIRAPETTITSIVELYRREQPAHPCATTIHAEMYYIKRLATLEKLAGALSGQYLFLDAECLLGSTSKTLDEITSWLELRDPLRQEYQRFTKTGEKGAGDSSTAIYSGKVDDQQRDHPSLGRSELAEALKRYKRARQSLICNSNHAIPWQEMK